MSYSNIKFSDNLTKNKACTITYSGHLFQNGSEFVNIVYGFGSEWHHTKEQDMERTDEGFVVKVNMLDFDLFNFCFRNSNYEWDNNNNQNYTAPITEEIKKEETIEAEEINFILNDTSVITDIMNNLCEIDVSTVEAKPFEPIEIIEPVTMAEGAPFEIEIETNTPVDIEDSLVNVTEAKALDQDIEKLFTDIYQEAATTDAPVPADNGFDMNNLIDEILSPVVKSDIFDEEASTENTFEDTISEDVHSNFFEDLDDLDEDENLDNKIDSLITSLFNNTRAFAESKKAEQENINEVEIDKAIDKRIDEILSETPVILEEASIEETEETVIDTVQQAVQEAVQEVVQETVQKEVTKKVPDFTIIEDEEESLIETLEETTSVESKEETALIEVATENGFVVSPRALGKFYMFKKKVKLAFSKLFVTLPKMFSKGFNTDNN